MTEMIATEAPKVYAKRVAVCTSEAGNSNLRSVLGGMSNGKGGGHSPKNLPLLLAGGQKLGLKQGQHLKFPVDSMPLSNLLLTMLQKMGVQQEKFVDSTGTVGPLL